MSVLDSLLIRKPHETRVYSGFSTINSAAANPGVYTELKSRNQALYAPWGTPAPRLLQGVAVVPHPVNLILIIVLNPTGI